MRLLVHYTNAFGNDCISKSCNTIEEALAEKGRIEAVFNKPVTKFYSYNPRVYFEPVGNIGE